MSNSTSNLLGLPQGTLNIVTYQPWDRVVKNPAAAAWLPLEAEARAALAALHGVANDNRLPHAALDDLRALMFSRLLSIALKKSNGGTLTSVEQDALDTFSDLIVERRVRAAEKALTRVRTVAKRPVQLHGPCQLRLRSVRAWTAMQCWRRHAGRPATSAYQGTVYGLRRRAGVQGGQR